ncbi:TIGR02680 family protein [Actinokineospora sp. 24-640]
MTDFGRWRLHRGGIVNIWQYREQTFDFSGGRAVFQGTNGSGKSRTLELLLPLCLDGDLRYLGSKGAGTVSIRRLMLEDYDGGPNRIGYAWVELRREGPAGEEFLTCGLGVKASATSQAISDSWRFVTPSRVGTHFRLVSADRVPLGPAALRDVLGADRIYDETGFRARVAEEVYGVPAARYGDLLHLQRTLRNPDIGLKVQDGQLEQILSDALPPLEAGVVEQLATSFEDLESIRENISRLGAADTAMSAFLTGYSGYALGALHAAGERANAARRALDSAHAEVDKLAAKAVTDADRHAAAEERVRVLEERDAELESAIDTLQALPAYQGLRDLRDREKLVERTREAAGTALDNAAVRRNHTDRAVETVLTVLRRLGDDLADATALTESTSDGLAAAGLDPRLCPTVPPAPDLATTTVTDRVRAKPDPEAEPLEVQRREPPRVAPEALTTALTEAADRAAEVGGAVAQRAALAMTLHERAIKLDRDRLALDAGRAAARDAQIEATESAGRRNEARQRFGVAAEVWCERVLAWTSAGPFADDHAPRPPMPPTPMDVLADPEVSRATRDAMRQWAAPHLAGLRQRAVAARQGVDALVAAIAAAEARTIELRKGVDATPPAPPYDRADRDPATGAPFYRLVDFTSGVDAEERAGLEAALQASGLLSAWVAADGTARDEGGIVAAPGRAAAEPLSTALVPAVGPDSPVSADTVGALLLAVSYGGEHDGLTVWPSGRWRAGVLHGLLAKPDAEYVGAGARAAARQRAAAELTGELARLREELTEAEGRLRAHSDAVAVWDAHLDAFPDDRELIGARVSADETRRQAAEATARAEQRRGDHTAADGRLKAAAGELARDAGEAGLATDTETLRAAHRSAAGLRDLAASLRDALGRRCAGTVRDLADAMHDYHAAVADRESAEAVAEEQCVEFHREAAALAELTAAVGGEAVRVQGQLAELDRERKATRDELPSARRAATEMSNQVVKTQTLLEARGGEIDSRTAAAAAAARGFAEALDAPGVWPAALPVERPPSDADAFALLADAVAASKRLPGEDAVLTKLQTLQAALAGTHNVAPERHAGILTVVVSAEDGPAPVAVAARRVARHLAERRDFLTERYQGIFALHLVRELAERLSAQIAVAEDLTRRMNEVLETARSSQGVHVRLEWQPAPWLDESTLEGLRLLRTPFAQRTPEQDARLQQVFTERIEAERDAASAGFGEILARALDYRSWYSFTVRVRDTGPDGKPRSRRLRQLSSGETRLISYVTLFAAAAAFYGAISSGSAMSPLRLVLLDEAFERLDDPTIARMLGLLVDLDMDWVITWPSGWGVSDRIPRMHIYDVLRPKSGHGVACTHTTWDGAALDRDDP